MGKTEIMKALSCQAREFGSYNYSVAQQKRSQKACAGIFSKIFKEKVNSNAGYL